MKTIKTLTAMTFVTMLSLASVPAWAGSCGSSTAHTHEAKTIVPLAEEAGFSTLVAAVKAAGLEDALNGEGPFTVFAPTDEAFAKLPEGTVEALLANPEQLKQVLMYHVVSGEVRAEAVVELDSAEALNGQQLAINTKKGVMINDAMVIKTDISASNGVVHVIDTVLIPQSM